MFLTWCRPTNTCKLMFNNPAWRLFLFSLCKKTPTTALFSFLKQSFTKSKLLGFKNFESLVFDAFLSKTEKSRVFLLALFNHAIRHLQYILLSSCVTTSLRFVCNAVKCTLCTNTNCVPLIATDTNPPIRPLLCVPVHPVVRLINTVI
jgi:hypothetical protein